MTFSENSVPGRPFRAYLAYLASCKARHVKTTKMILKSNAVRLELPNLGEMRCFFKHFFVVTQRTAQSPQLRPCLYGMPEITSEWLFLENSMPELPSRAYLALGKARHVKTTKKELKNITTLGWNSEN